MNLAILELHEKSNSTSELRLEHTRSPCVDHPFHQLCFQALLRAGEGKMGVLKGALRAAA